MKNTIIYPGTFDPITFGHIDIIERASNMFEKVLVGIIKHPVKSNFMFSIEERIEFVKKSAAKFSNVEVEPFEGLLIHYARRKNIRLVLRGLRAITDFEYEFQMALTNKKLDNEIETIFMMTNQNYSYLSSSMVKEIAKYKGDISGFVPDFIVEKFNADNTLEVK
ncbi:MAG TPA: pantetheine-phosphate adenylyltransferase [bacterium]|nr:pantetheine-phosphate adenylyltransferase [bacterium]HPN29898.1 pantetheine-phosphate adenylyltransferase [bacterium]